MKEVRCFSFDLMGNLHVAYTMMTYDICIVKSVLGSRKDKLFIITNEKIENKNNNKRERKKRKEEFFIPVGLSFP